MRRKKCIAGGDCGAGILTRRPTDLILKKLGLNFLARGDKREVDSGGREGEERGEMDCVLISSDVSPGMKVALASSALEPLKLLAPINANGRSTRGASKQRRDQISRELAELRQLLPLHHSVQERLFQLQVMSLSCTLIRRHQFFARTSSEANLMESCAITAALHDHFLLAVTGEGKLLALSENFQKDPLCGFSTEEWMAQSDSLFDLIDPRDHCQLNRALAGPISSTTEGERRAFACRWRAPKLGGVTKRQADWDDKPTLAEGRLLMASNGALMFVALCRPLITSFVSKDESDDEMPADPTLFRIRLDLDLRVIGLCQNAKFQLSPKICSSSASSDGSSLYHFMHPASTHSLAQLHRKLLDQPVLAPGNEQIAPSPLPPLLLHLSAEPTTFPPQYFHAIFTRREPHQIEAIWQQLSDLEANALVRTDWLYGSLGAETEKRKMRKAGRSTVQTISMTNSSSSLQPAPKAYSGWNTPFCTKLANKSATDVNNNDMGQWPGSCCWPEEAANLLEELPSLVVLPELDDQDLDEFFRQVEQRGEANNNRAMKVEPMTMMDGGGGEERNCCNKRQKVEQ